MVHYPDPSLNASKPISVLLVGGTPAYLHILKRFFRELFEGEVGVVGETADWETAMAMAILLQPDVILLDLAIPGRPCLEAIPSLRAALPGTGIIVLAMIDFGYYRQVVLAAGADNFVPKANMIAELLPAIQQVMQHRKRRLNHEQP